MANEKVTHALPAGCVAQSSNTSGAGAAATFTISAPGAGYRIVVGQISWSYDAAPTGGAVTLSDGTTSIVWKVTAGGPGFITLDPPLAFGDNLGITVVTAAGGGAILATAHAAAYKQKATDR